MASPVLLNDVNAGYFSGDESDDSSHLSFEDSLVFAFEDIESDGGSPLCFQQFSHYVTVIFNINLFLGRK